VGMNLKKMTTILIFLVFTMGFINFLVNIAGWEVVLISIAMALTVVSGVLYFIFLLEK
jgi:phosphatidylglycerophosphate synthase